MFDKTAYDQKFDKENYDHINLVLPKGYKDLLASVAKEVNISRNLFIRQAIEEKLVDMGLL